MNEVSISISMTVAQWNVVMNALGQRPFAEVAEIIGEMKGQVEKQLAAQPQTATPVTEEIVQ
jgi:hypothetical protein